ncbi:MAG: YbaK/EbsC family protein [Candidatus Obscuribacterales bacterium]
MTDKLHDQVATALASHQLEYSVFACDPDFADTALFCEKYGFQLGQSANAIIVATKVEPVRYACCIVLANTKLDVNRTVAKLLEAKKVSFATAEQTMTLTGMQIGGVTPFGLSDIPLYVDAAVMASALEVILGGGNRSTKVVLKPEQLLKLPNVKVIDGLAIAK